MVMVLRAVFSIKIKFKKCLLLRILCFMNSKFIDIQIDFFCDSKYINPYILFAYYFLNSVLVLFNINKQCKISLRKQGKLWEKMYSYWWIDVLVVFSFLQFQWLNHRTFFFSPDVLIERGLLYVVRIWPLPYSFHGISIGQTTINDRNAFVSTLFEN